MDNGADDFVHSTRFCQSSQSNSGVKQASLPDSQVRKYSPQPTGNREMKAGPQVKSACALTWTDATYRTEATDEDHKTREQCYGGVSISIMKRDSRKPKFDMTKST